MPGHLLFVLEFYPHLYILALPHPGLHYAKLDHTRNPATTSCAPRKAGSLRAGCAAGPPHAGCAASRSSAALARRGSPSPSPPPRGSVVLGTGPPRTPTLLGSSVSAPSAPAVRMPGPAVRMPGPGVPGVPLAAYGQVVSCSATAT